MNDANRFVEDDIMNNEEKTKLQISNEFFKYGYNKALEDVRLFMIDNVFDWSDEVDKIHQKIEEPKSEDKKDHAHHTNCPLNKEGEE